MDPVEATVPLIADFLIHFRRDKALSVTAVKGYRAAINSVLALKGVDLAQSRELSMLIRSFSKELPARELRPPSWDLVLVLESLTKAPYEPLREATDSLLSEKTLFLLALASAKRIGELHGLSHRISHSEGWGEIAFEFVPGFVAKTQNPSVPDPRFEGFTIPALTRSNTGIHGRRLCPVRAIRQYLARTAPFRSQSSRLFLSAGRNKKEVSKNTISFWLRRTIVRAYQLSGRDCPLPFGHGRSVAWVLLSSFRGITP